MNALKKILLLFGLFSSFAFSQQIIQSVNRWTLSKPNWGIVDSSTTVYYESEEIVFYNVGIPLSINLLQISFENTQNQNSKIPTKFSAEFSLENIENADSIYIYVSFTDSIGNWCFLGEEHKLYPKNLGLGFKTFTWDMSEIGGISSFNKITFAFKFVTQKVSKTSGTIRMRNLNLSSTTGIAFQEQIPSGFELSQNYPNPFNPTTKIEFALPRESNVTLKIYNVLGQEVATLVNNVMPAGFHAVDFNATKLPSGMYVYRIQASNFVQTKKMMLAK